jgi:protein-S-isoprenylcysteine O-methyltransferase Ste14
MLRVVKWVKTDKKSNAPKKMKKSGLGDVTTDVRGYAVSLRTPVLILLSIVFTLALTFATLELPAILNSILRAYFPDIYWEPETIEALMSFARPIGYASLAVIAGLIILGFKTGRRHLSSLGSFAFFLPAFGYFAASMFFLTGIGILRVMWLPFWDSSPALLKLGNVAYLPYWIVLYPLKLSGVEGIQFLKAGNLLAGLIVGAGLLIFCIGTFTWLYGKIEKRTVFDFWIYKYSRHPQYLGFIVWSYGVMLLTALAPVPFGGYQPEPSLPWLISTLLVVCVAMSEEISMIRKADESYKRYRETTPFMLPLPRFLSRIFTAPNRILLKKDFPERSREIFYTFVIGFIILVLLSLLVQEMGQLSAI